MTTLAERDEAALKALEAQLSREFELCKGNRLSMDLTRGKPAADQLSLSDGLDDVLQGRYIASDGTDTRNYGDLRGIPEARALGAQLLDTSAEQVICWGNSSLTLMHLVLETAMQRGLWGDERRWGQSQPVRILTPVPGYDRHFGLCQAFGIEMVNIPMTDTGPDMHRAVELASRDASIKGIWCVPKYSNPTGCIYSAACVQALAQLPEAAAADDFVVLYDNAYAVHDFEFPGTQLTPIMPLAEQAGTADHVVMFSSTSKITYASGGLGFVGASPRVLQSLDQRLAVASIGPDKVNQLRHARFLSGRLQEHMAQHAALLKPKFDLVQQVLEAELGPLDVARWTRPEGGYFVSVDTQPGLASRIGGLAAQAGLKLTPAGATFPYGKDPDDTNLRIAPSFAALSDLKTAMEVFALCVKLATVRDQLEQRAAH